MGIEDRIAEVVRQHSITDAPTWANERICLCGGRVRVMPPGPDFSAHVAAAVVAELQLTEEALIPTTKCADGQYRGNVPFESVERAKQFRDERFNDGEVYARWTTGWEKAE